MKSGKIIVVIVTLTFVVLLLVVVRPTQQVDAEQQIGTPVTIKAPLGLPPVPIPSDNPLTAEKIALGRRLYYDPALSADKTVSCATCHHPDHGCPTAYRTRARGACHRRRGRQGGVSFCLKAMSALSAHQKLLPVRPVTKFRSGFSGGCTAPSTEPSLTQVDIILIRF